MGGQESQPGSCPSGTVCNKQTYKCSVPEPVSTEQLRRCLDKDIEQLKANLGSTWAFQDGEAEASRRRRRNWNAGPMNQIPDGGSNMYDGGNKIIVFSKNESKWSSHLAHNNKCSDDQWSSTGVGDIQYFTCKKTTPMTVWFAGFHSPSGDIESFRVDGDNGADNHGHASGGSLSQWDQGALWGHYKQVYGSPNPSINQMVLVPDSRWTSEWSKFTNSGYHEVKRNTGEPVHTLMYVMWSGWTSSPRRRRVSWSGVQYSSWEFKKAMESITVDC